MNKLKQGWKSVILGNVAELQRGFDLPSAKRINGNIPIISSGELVVIIMNLKYPLLVWLQEDMELLVLYFI